MSNLTFEYYLNDQLLHLEKRVLKIIDKDLVFYKLSKSLNEIKVFILEIHNRYLISIKLVK